jgi:hypothetical protein
MARFFVGRLDVNLKNRWASIGGLSHSTLVPISGSALLPPEQDTVGNPSPFVSSLTQANAAAMADALGAPLAFPLPAVCLISGQSISNSRTQEVVKTDGFEGNS